MKKNSCKSINPKKYSCEGLKKIHTRNLITKKNSCSSKIPLPPHNFSNGPSLRGYFSSDLWLHLTWPEVSLPDQTCVLSRWFYRSRCGLFCSYLTAWCVGKRKQIIPRWIARVKFTASLCFSCRNIEYLRKASKEKYLLILFPIIATRIVNWAISL